MIKGCTHPGGTVEKWHVSVEPVKNLMGFASVMNDCFVENLKIVQGSRGFFGPPSQPADGKGGYRDTTLSQRSSGCMNT